MNNLIVSSRWDLIELLNGQVIRLDREDDHEFTLAASSDMALERLAEEHFNTVVMDSSSPEVNIYLLMDELIRLKRPEWVLLLTTSETEADILAYKREQDEAMSVDGSIAEIFAMIDDFPDNGYS